MQKQVPVKEKALVSRQDVTVSLSLSQRDNLELFLHASHPSGNRDDCITFLQHARVNQLEANLLDQLATIIERIHDNGVHAKHEATRLPRRRLVRRQAHDGDTRAKLGHVIGHFTRFAKHDNEFGVNVDRCLDGAGRDRLSNGEPSICSEDRVEHGNVLLGKRV